VACAQVEPRHASLGGAYDGAVQRDDFGRDPRLDTREALVGSRSFSFSFCVPPLPLSLSLLYFSSLRVSLLMKLSRPLAMVAAAAAAPAAAARLFGYACLTFSPVPCYM